MFEPQGADPRLWTTLVLVLASAAVVYYDQRDMEIPLLWLVLLPLALLAVSWSVDLPTLGMKMLGASLVLIGGLILTAALPEKLGEGDILYAASLSFCLGFFPWMTAVGLACAGAIVFFGLQALRRGGWDGRPVAFTPFLFWGAISQILVEEVLF